MLLHFANDLLIVADIAVGHKADDAQMILRVGRVERRLSQIDIPPTLLGLLGISYTSRFYGQDLFALEPGRERAFIGNYQQLGYLRDDRLVQLGPKRVVEEVRPAFTNDQPQPPIPLDPQLVSEAVRYYQTASYRFAHGMMGDVPSTPTGPQAAKQ